MPRRPHLFALLLVAALAIVTTGAPAWAHGPMGLGAEEMFDAGPAAASGGVVSTLPGLLLSTAPEAPGVPWTVLGVALASAALIWWRPRRVAMLALVLLLVFFAFEDGLHSVHHGFDRNAAASCAVAAVATQLSATTIDGVPTCDVIAPVGATIVPAGDLAVAVRLIGPDQGRAPPAVTL